MSLLSSQPPLSCRHLCSLKFTNPVPPVFSSHRKPPKSPPPLFTKTLFLTNSDLSSVATTTTTGLSPPPPHATNVPNSNYNSPPEDAIKPITLVGEQDVPLEGVIQFEKPSSSSFKLISKWGRVAMLAGGDVLALLLFSAIGRFSHGFPVVDSETLRTADPFIAGWFLSAYFLGGYGEDGRGINGWSKAVTAAVKSWAVGIPHRVYDSALLVNLVTSAPAEVSISFPCPIQRLGIIIRAVSASHIPPTNFILVTMGSTGVLLVGWRTLLLSILSNDKTKSNDDYRQGNPFEFFELLSSLVRRW